MENDFSEFQSVKNPDLLGLSESSSFPQPPAIVRKSFVFPSGDLTSITDLEFPSPSPSKSAWEYIDNCEAMTNLSYSLYFQGRLHQALLAMQHAEKLNHIQKLKELKAQAAEREDYDSALQYRNTINLVEKELQTVEEVEKWLSEEKGKSLSDIAESLNSEEQNSFWSKFKLPEVKGSVDIERAIEQVNKAEIYIKVKSLIKTHQSFFVYETFRVLNAVKNELKKSLKILAKLKPFLRRIEDEELSVYTKGLEQVYLVGARVSEIIKYFELPELAKLCEEIKKTWFDCETYLKLETSVPKICFASETLCSICFCPVESPTKLCGASFHPTCINFWINRITTDPPKIKLT